MKNPVICKNCQAENPAYSHICSGCKHYLRDKIVNIDLWETVVLLLESPATAFNRIIHSEHKNFIVFLTFLFALRLLILSRFMSLSFLTGNVATISVLTGYVIVFLSGTSFQFLFAWITTILLNKKEYSVRLRENYSLLVYSNTPNIISVILLFPIELIVFGEYLFSNNPNPFQIKPFFAYTLLLFETGVIVWSLTLNYISYKTLTGSRGISILISIIYSTCLSGIIMVLARVMFIL